ncbi:MAG: UDP-glucose 4-epimerase GalE [Bacteroidota bacterium]|nr:UDP-glucose 4-epimerase GalE [Bacteroidota bacterium]
MGNKQKILVTGGLGYIGSHTVVALIQAGYEVVILDDLSNSSLMILDRIEQITGVRPSFYQINLLDKKQLYAIFSDETDLSAVIHFAAFKAVGESVREPVKYFTNNLVSLLHLLEVMDHFQVTNLVFSSSATVYGDARELPVKESTPFQKALSSYGSTKQMGEEILEKTAAVKDIQVISLRYFNPVGAHDSAWIGELPNGVPNNLMPYITQVAAGLRPSLTVFGNDYDTPDGTCVRDYIHVVDLAKAHVKSCGRLIDKKNRDSFEVFNIGTGKGLSVLEIIHAFEKQNQLSLKYEIGPRRSGDSPAMYADVTRAKEILRWEAELGLTEIVTSAWKWEQTLHPHNTCL